tara:strand:- start:565 stop:1188 length:624 start_codon:yes stop_codon:yes gene_type:complete
LVCQIYLITPSSFDLEAFAPKLESVLDSAPVACVQLRLKSASDIDICQAANMLLPLCNDRDVAFLINDRPDLVAKTGADGAHIGQNDYGYQQARTLSGPDSIVGVTCHNSRHLAINAAESGADYVAFGAFFETSSKTTKSVASIDILQWWNEVTTIPSVAIGGITASNCRPLVKAGADFIAVIGAVWSHPKGPSEGVKEIFFAISET